MRQKVDAQILFPDLKIPKFRKWVSYNPTPPYYNFKLLVVVASSIYLLSTVSCASPNSPCLPTLVLTSTDGERWSHNHIIILYILCYNMLYAVCCMYDNIVLWYYVIFYWVCKQAKPVMRDRTFPIALGLHSMLPLTLTLTPIHYKIYIESSKHRCGYGGLVWSHRRLNASWDG